jgi:hypothetical protein
MSVEKEADVPMKDSVKEMIKVYKKRGQTKLLAIMGVKDD